MKKNNFKLALATMIAICILNSCKKDDSKPAEVNSIKVTTLPSKIEYFEGESLDLSGIAITITMDNGVEKILSLADLADNDITCSPANETVLSTGTTKVTITHTTTGVNSNLAVLVKNIAVSDISIKTPPLKTDYYEGDALELNGLIVTISMNNGDNKDVSFSNFADNEISCSPINGTILATTYSSVSIKHKTINATASQTIIVNEAVVLDIDDNSYQIVVIGKQVWMAENLKTTKFTDGIDIALVTNNVNWSNLTGPGYCWYNNDKTQHSENYGALYNWYVVETGKLCPTGWHVPSDSEWSELDDYLTANGHSGAEGVALKTTSGWKNDGNGTDNYGFTAYPSGSRDGVGVYVRILENSLWWSSTETSQGLVWGRYLSYTSDTFDALDAGKDIGFSVRCVRD